MCDPDWRRGLGRRRTIAEASRISGLTPRAIRLYEAQGLISPERCSALGIRYFHDEQIAALIRIARARRAGLSLKEIADLIDIRRRQGRAAAFASLAKICSMRSAALEAQRRELEQIVHEASNSLKST